jgi:RNA polymerase sigma-70 factor, ECF subfamily
MNTTDQPSDFPTQRSGIAQRELVRVLVAERVKMLAYIDSLVRDESLSEDLFQEVCMLAVEKAASIRDELHLVKWLRTTARFHALNAMQKRLNNVSLANDVLDSLESKWQSAYDATNTNDRADALRTCVDKMPTKSKDLIQKRYVQEMTYEQLAQNLGRPIDSLYVTFSRIFATLGNCIMEQLRSTGGNARD